MEGGGERHRGTGGWGGGGDSTCLESSGHRRHSPTPTHHRWAPVPALCPESESALQLPPGDLDRLVSCPLPRGSAESGGGVSARALGLSFFLFPLSSSLSGPLFGPLHIDKSFLGSRGPRKENSAIFAYH